MITAECEKLRTLSTAWRAGIFGILWPPAVGCLVAASSGQAADLRLVVPIALAGPIFATSFFSGQEYVRQHRSTRLAMPNLKRWVPAHLVVLGVLTSAIAVVSGVLLAVVGGASFASGIGLIAYLLLTSLFTLALTELFQSTLTGALATVGVMWVLPAIAPMVGAAVSAWFPTTAMERLISGHAMSLSGCALVALWLLVIGAVTAVRRSG